tara:strand:- start:1083 stop:1256 length:174 start_codon:yes stop_codon:yes gene_type:complete
MLTSVAMKKSFDNIKQLTTKAEASIYKTAQLDQALAQIEASLSRKENQKVSDKSKKS